MCVVLLMLIVFTISKFCVADLKSINAAVSRDCKVQFLLHTAIYNTELHSLRDYSSINFIDIHIPKLQSGDVSNLPKLKCLNVTGVGLEGIKPGSFWNLPRLESIQLMFNYITEIKHGVFNNLRSLKWLNLNGNSINHIEGDAFDNMPNLKVLVLDHNRISKLDPEWFKKTHLAQLSFTNNLIKTIPNKTFANTKNTRLNLKLNRNMISEIEEGAFDCMGEFFSLDLSGNKLEEFKEETARKLEFLTELDISENMIRCFEEPVFYSFATMKVVNIKYNDFTKQCKKKLRDYEFVIAGLNLVV